MISRGFNAVGWFGDGVLLSAKCTSCGQSLNIIDPRMPNIRLEAHNCPNQKYDGPKLVIAMIVVNQSRQLPVRNSTQ